MRRHGLKKGLSLLLVLCMILSLLPMTALADEISEPSAAVEEQESAAKDETTNTPDDTTGDKQDDTGEAGSEAGTDEAGSETGTGETGSETGTGEAGTGEAGTGETGEAGTGETGEAGTGETGEAGTGETGEAGTGETGEGEEEKSFVDKIIDEIKDILTPIEGDKAENSLPSQEPSAEEPAANAPVAETPATKVDPDQALAAVYALGEEEAPDTDDDGFYKIVHLDAGRKYFSVDNIKSLIDKMAAAGYNQLELYLSDNQGFRFALEDPVVTVGDNEYDLTDAFGPNGDYGAGCLTQEDMHTILSYAKRNNIEVVPCLNTPGHMGAILRSSALPSSFKWNDSNSSLNIEDADAVAFALALLDKYASYFVGEGCKYFNIGADEFANDIYPNGGMGFGALTSQRKYQYFVDYVNAAAQTVINAGMTPRAFNDGMYYGGQDMKPTSGNDVISDIQVCYWSSGWNGYNVASASTIAQKGHDMINTHGDYYYVLGKDSNMTTGKVEASDFDASVFAGPSSELDASGAMFCIWCDDPNAETEEEALEHSLPYLQGFASTLPNEVTASLPGSGQVTIAAAGLTALGVAAAAEDPEIAGATEIVTYSLTPMVGETAYTGEAEVTLSVPSGWTNYSNIRGFVVNANGSVSLIKGTGAPSAKTYTFTVPHFSDVGLMLQGSTTEVEKVELAYQGSGTYTFEYSRELTAADIMIDDPDVVSVEITEVKPIGGSEDSTKITRGSSVSSVSGGEQYVVVSNSQMMSANGTTLSGGSVPASGNTVPDASLWTFTKVSDGVYTISWTNGDTTYYLGYKQDSSNFKKKTYTYTPVLQASPCNWSFDSNRIYIEGLEASNNGWTAIYYLTYNNGWTMSTTSSNVTLYSVETEEIPATAPTSYQHTLVFTGRKAGTATVTLDGRYSYPVQVGQEDVTGISTNMELWVTNQQVIPNDGTEYSTGSGKNTDNNDYTYYYVTIDAADVNFEDGKDISTLTAKTGTAGGNTAIYWKATYLDLNNLTKQDNAGGKDHTLDGDDFSKIRYWEGKWAYYSIQDNQWKEFGDNYQLVAYYLQVTPITDEVTTNVVDWGPFYSQWGQSDYNWFFNNTWHNYVKGGHYIFLDFAVVYEDGSQNPSSFPVDNTMFFHSEGIYTKGRRLGSILFTQNENSDYEIWKITVQDGTSSGYSEKDSFTVSYTGTEKTVWTEDMGGDPLVQYLDYKDEQQGKLVRIYVRKKITQDDLVIRYVDQSNNNELIYQYGIKVKEGTNFKGYRYSNGTITPNTVENYWGASQEIQTNLNDLAELKDKYVGTGYTLVGAEVSEDCKTLTLYYNYQSDAEFVYDFGLPMRITPANVGFTSTPTSVTLGGTGVKSVRADGANIVFQPVSAADTGYTVTATYTFSDGSNQPKTLKFIPATTVYYEEGFMGSGNKGTRTQAASKVGDRAHYGYDVAYASDSGPSHATELTSSMVGQIASFSFKGTGVDIYANCSADTGMILITVKSGSTIEKMAVVNTAMVDGYTGLTSNQAVTAYNVPIVSFDGLEYGTHTVTITHVESGKSTGDMAAKSVKLDGFRVHGTLDVETTAAYVRDNEANPAIVELRNNLLQITYDAKAADSLSYASQIDLLRSQVLGACGDASIEAALITQADRGPVTVGGQIITATTDLLDNGPKNEIYLKSGDILTFNVSGNAQVGIKSLMGSGAACTINGIEQKVSTTDMFYQVSADTVTIENTGSGILAVTELKVF